MKKFFRRLPGRLLRISSFIGVVGILLAKLATELSPEVTTIPAFFGLTYAFWLLISLIGLAYAISRARWFMAAMVLFVLLFTSDLMKRTIVPMNEASEEQAKLSIMSYNVRLFDLYNWTDGKNTRNQIFDFLKENPTDVICFQEFYHTERKGVFDTRDTLLTFLDNKYYHERYTHQMNGKQYFGVVTFSKYPIVGKGEIEFASDVNNFCIYSDILVDGDTVRVYNAHLASIRLQKEDYTALEEGPDTKDAKRLVGRFEMAYMKRASQVEVVSAHIARSPHPVILSGDFNDTPVSYAYEQFTQCGLEDAFVARGKGIGSTHIGAYPFFRIDYVMHSPSMRAERFKTHPVKYSDHRPVEAHLSW